MREVRELIDRVADTDVTVLIRGESGTGKELVARAIHSASPRRDTAVRQGQLRGAAVRAARVRAVRLRARRLHRRHPAQARQVRVRQPRHDVPRRDQRDAAAAAVEAAAGAAGRRVRAARRPQDVHVDVRVVAATNRDLENAVADGQFREDLFFRLNVVCITLPPLRQRRDEIPAADRLFLRAATREHYNKPPHRAGDRHAAAVRRIRLAGQRARAREPGQADGDPRHRRRRSAASWRTRSPDATLRVGPIPALQSRGAAAAAGAAARGRRRRRRRRRRPRRRRRRSDR